jgi:hypothetical protein
MGQARFLVAALEGFSRYPNLTISFLMLAAISRYLRCSSRSFRSSPEVCWVGCVFVRAVVLWVNSEHNSPYS